MLIYGRKGVVDAKDVDDWWAQRVEILSASLSVEKAMFQASMDVWVLSKKGNIRTWNPLLVNYLPGEDSEILAGIMFLGKDGTWQVCDRCVSIKQKLKVMGVGEALADSDLVNY